MQITLNQDEIIHAIKSYVCSQINVAEGQDIEIDLKATRGETGFTAVLNIVPAKLNTVSTPVSAKKASAVVATSTAPKAASGSPFKKPAPVEEAKAEEPETEPETESQSEDPLEGAMDDELDRGTTEEQAEAEADGEEAEAAEAAPAPAPRSIFSKAKA